MALKIWEREVEIMLAKTRLERIQQLKKWNVQTHDLTTWLAILMEEVGEVSEQVLRNKFPPLKDSFDPQKLESELIQVAAVSLAMAQCLKNGKA